MPLAVDICSNYIMAGASDTLFPDSADRGSTSSGTEPPADMTQVQTNPNNQATRPGSKDQLAPRDVKLDSDESSPTILGSPESVPVNAINQIPRITLEPGQDNTEEEQGAVRCVLLCLKYEYII